MLKENLKATGMFLAAGMFVWLAVSSIVFAIRHPWATDTERLIYVVDALTFQKIDYAEARGLTE